MLQAQEEIVETIEQDEQQDVVELSASELQWVGGGGALGMTV